MSIRIISWIAFLDDLSIRVGSTGDLRLHDQIISDNDRLKLVSFLSQTPEMTIISRIMQLSTFGFE
jgi:hypothetical protein